MATLKLRTPDGTAIPFDVPDNATPDMKKQAAQMAIAQYKASKATASAQPQKQGMVGKAWDALGKPAAMAKDGLQQMTGLQSDAQNAIAQKTGLPIGTEPTGNMTRDVIANIPRIAGESMAEVAPSFIDRASILTAGAGAAAKGAGMVAGKVLSKAAPALEAGSGLGKGTLNAAFKDPSIITDFGGKATASALYNDAKEGASVGKRSVKVVSDAFKALNDGDHMTAPDAFKARKVVRQMLRSKSAPYPTDDLMQLEEHLGNMVFSSANKADQIYKRAIQGEQMRNFSRLNKNGSTGPMSAAIMAKIPALAPFFSPAIQGAGASAAGAAAQIGKAGVENAGGMGAMVDSGFSRLAARKGKSRATR